MFPMPVFIIETLCTRLNDDMNVHRLCHCIVFQLFSFCVEIVLIYTEHKSVNFRLRSIIKVQVARGEGTAVDIPIGSCEKSDF